MNSLLYYLLQVIIASGLLYLYYHIALRNKKFHQYNRFYLLAAVIISISAPFINIPVYFTQQETQSSIVLQTLTVISEPYQEQVTEGVPGAAIVKKAFDPVTLLYYGYALLAALALVKITFSLLRIYRLKKNNPVEKIDTISFINTTEPGTPFSFFRWLFWNKNIELRSEKGEQIFRHELFHIQQKHSIDLLFMELLTVIFWINPFFHIMKKELRAIHEFLADQFAVTRSDKWNYAELLLMQALQTKHSLVNPFFHNQIKRRIAMITNPKKTSFRYLRKLLVLPVAVLIITAFAFKYKQADDPSVALSKSALTIVIDAGHGGIDPGVESPDGKFNEAHLSLEIAKKIKELSSEYNINVVMTREDDALPGSATSSAEGNRKRVDITNRVKPVAFIAIHVNSVATKNFQEIKSGFEAYVSAKRTDKKSREIASALLQELSAVYKTSMAIRSREHAGILVLDQNTCPAILLQCGYINNTADLAFISDKANQEKIARKILSAVSGYNNHKTETSFLSVTDTPAVRFTKKSTVTIGNEAVFIASDSVVFHFDKETKVIDSVNGVFQGPLTGADKPLIIMNGEEVPYSYLTQKTIVAKDITIFSANDPQAIALYGKPAANGVLIFNNAEISDNVSKQLPEVVIIGYTDSPKQASFITSTAISPIQVGSSEWRKYFERNLNGNIPVSEGWKPGIYKLILQFIADEEGDIYDMQVQGYKNSATAIHCLEVLKNAGKLSVLKETASNGKITYLQPLIFQVIDPSITSK